MKKVLIIANEFPPMGLGSVQRISRFCKYLPRNGWQPIVLTSTPKYYYARDEHLLTEIKNEGAEIYRTPASGSVNFLNDQRITPFPNERRRRIKRKLRQAFFITDSGLFVRGWKRKALKKADEIFSRHKIDIIFATAPPFTDFIIGADLKKKYDVPLAVDYRESWTQNPFNFYPTPFHHFINMKREKEILRVADKVITANRRIKELLIEKYPTLTHNDVWIVPNTYDSEEISSAVSWLPKTNKMRFTYSGTFADLHNPGNFLAALDLVFTRNGELRKKIEICFLGVFSKSDLNAIKELGLKDAANIVGYVNHFEYIKYLQSSDVLWFIINKGKGSDMITPGAMYEYIGMRKPIIACIPDGAAKGTLKKYEAVKICEPDDVESIAASILEYYELFRKNTLPAANMDVVKQFDVSVLTAELARQLEFLIAVNPQIVRKEALVG